MEREWNLCTNPRTGQSGGAKSPADTGPWARAFTADGPNRLCVADITYVPAWEGFLYLAVILDVFSREGWYNPHRRHSSLGYLSPIDFEKQYIQHKDGAQTPNVELSTEGE